MGVFIYARIHFAAIDNVRQPNQDSVEAFGQVKFTLIVLTIVSFFIAFISSLADEFIARRLVFRRSVGLVILTGLIIDAAIITLVAFISFNIIRAFIYQIVQETPEPLNYELFYPIIAILAFTLLLARIFIEIDRKIGPGNLWKFLRGKFFKPRVEERIFMFIDLRDSTALAERLGHIKFSRLLQDCYRDLTIVDKYHAQVYQYVGDEVVLTWMSKRGIKNADCIRGFFAFLETIEKRSDYYLKKYGTVPYFKAGANIGPAVVTEVGQIKREITYHGDTLNSASRIQDLCNQFDARLIISEQLCRELPKTDSFDFTDLGVIPLKGKTKEFHLMKVSQKGN